VRPSEMSRESFELPGHAQVRSSNLLSGSVCPAQSLNGNVVADRPNTSSTDRPRQRSTCKGPARKPAFPNSVTTPDVAVHRSVAVVAAPAALLV
jgi:hypothetical protein